MIISVASGKGGTGKTTVAVNLALSLENIQFLDCDVEEPNAHLFLKPKIEKIEPVAIPVPEVDESKCNFCGKCAQVCEYHAIACLPKEVLIFEELCHGCGGCTMVCPQKAITEKHRETGVVRVGKTNGIEFADGILNPGEPMSPPVIRKVKKKIKKDKVTIIDVPPGTSCPVVEAVRGSDFCILVTEPTPFGLNDLILAVEVLKKMKIPIGIVLNRSDIGDDEVDLYCKKQNIPILLKIPFDREIASAYSKGVPIVERFPEYQKKFQSLFEKTRRLVWIRK